MCCREVEAENVSGPLRFRFLHHAPRLRDAEHRVPFCDFVQSLEEMIPVFFHADDGSFFMMKRVPRFDSANRVDTALAMLLEIFQYESKVSLSGPFSRLRKLSGHVRTHSIDPGNRLPTLATAPCCLQCLAASPPLSKNPCGFSGIQLPIGKWSHR